MTNKAFRTGPDFEHTDYLIIKIKHMKKLLIYSVIFLSVGLFSCGNNNTQSQDTVDSAKAVNKEVKPVQADASNFAVEAANGGMMEVELGKIAQENASNPRVKAFGEMMVKDHTEAGNNLKSIASSLNIALPDSVSNDSRKEIDHMKMKKGKEFDKAYVSMMVDDHKKDIAEFRKCADNCSDSTIKSFASNTLPVLMKHLDSIQAIAEKKP
jgi:putative membrane protein